MSVESTQAPKFSLQMRHYAFIFALAWLLILSLLYSWHLWSVYKNTLETARIQASDSFEKDLVYRRWASEHGGVYVRPTNETPPNPYLSHIENRDITTTSGVDLTLMNPAYMTRQVHELALEQYGHLGHITSLNPLNPGNVPDAWEAKALRAFEQGESELFELSKVDDTEYMRLIRPMTTEAHCLKCHATQGYKLGDLRGGISVSVPMTPLWKIMYGHMVNVTTGYIFVWLFGLGGIGLSIWHISRRNRARERAEEALAKSEALLAETGRMAKVGGWELDAETLEVSWTQETYQIHEIPIGQKPPLEEALNFYHPDDRPKLEAAVQRALENGEPYDMEVRFITAKGKELWTHTICNPIRENGKTVRLTGTFQDITERKRAEDELERINKELEIKTQQANEASTFKTRLLSMVSHDLRTPLHNILGYVSIMQTVDGDCGDESIASLGKIEKNAKALSTLIDNLLDQAQLDAGKLELLLEPVNLGAVITEAMESVSGIARLKGIELFYHKTELKVVADHKKLLQVLVNVLGNAVKYTEKGAVNVHAKVEQSNALIFVTDTGIGMSEQAINTAFVSFERGRNGRNSTLIGSGLGLSISKELIAKMNGEITIESQPDKGTTVTARLPLSQESPIS